MDEKEMIRKVEGILIEKTAGFEEDERKACVKLWKTVARRKIRGRPESWAAAIYYTYCRMVFKEEASRKSVEDLFKVSQGTFTRMCTEIRKLLSLDYYDKRFTPARIYAESPLAELEEALTNITEMGAVESFFEVKAKKENGVLIVDLDSGREYFVREKTALEKLKVGGILPTTIYPVGDVYVFPRLIRLLDPENLKHRAIIESVKDYYSGKYIGKALEIQRDMCEAAKEYFGSTDPVFEDAREAEKALNDFTSWHNHERKLPGKGKTPTQLYTEKHEKLPETQRMEFPRELLEARDVGLVFDEDGGTMILPHYGRVKELFQGDLRNVPDYKSLVRSLVSEKRFIPSFLIRSLIDENSEQAVRVFTTVYKNVRTIKDIYKIFEEHRADWNEKPKPSTIPIDFI